MTARLALEGVSVAFGGRRVVQDLDLSVAEGEVLALLGRSGAGKSTVLRLLLGLVAPATGRVLLDGAVASAPGRLVVPPEERGLAMVFQDLALWPHLTVLGNLTFVLDAIGTPPAERQRRARAALAEVGLEGAVDRRPGDLSGGERQRVAIARALVQRPRAVLLDEPLAHLDAILTADLRALFRRVFQGSTVLWVTHDAREVAGTAHRVAVLDEGRVVQSGTLEELRRRPDHDVVAALLADA